MNIFYHAKLSVLDHKPQSDGIYWARWKENHFNWSMVSFDSVRSLCWNFCDESDFHNALSANTYDRWIGPFLEPDKHGFCEYEIVPIGG